MKNRLFVAATLLFATALCSLPLSLSAQAPQAIPYQAVARDTNGSVLANQLVGLRLSIRNLSPGGTIVYQETHTATTNNLGLLNLNIGLGTPLTGTLPAINWGNGAKYIQVEMDVTGGTNYTDMGTTQLMSVPYALSSGSEQWTANGNHISNLNSGYVGIGNSNPVRKLDVYESQSSTEIARFKGGGGWNQILVESGNSSVHLGMSEQGGVGFVGTQTAQDFALRAGSDIKMTIKNTSGNVGIGTQTPQAKLDIAGNIKIADGTQGTGKVLTSNSNGLASWNTLSETDPKVSSSTNNQIPKWNGTSLTDGIITDNGSRIGIANNNPTSKLHVLDNQQFTNIARFQGPSGWNQIIVQSGNSSVDLGVNDPVGFGYVGTKTPQDFAIRANNSVKLLIEDTTGNVGIGNSSPQAKLHVLGDIQSAGNQTTHTQGAHLEWNKDGFSGKTYLLNHKGSGLGGMVFGEVDSTNIITQHLNIDLSGRVGIGISNPGSKLHVSDSVNNSTVATFESGGGGSGDILVKSGIASVELGMNDLSGYGYVGTRNQKDFVIRTNQSAKIFISDATGNVGIGTTNPYGKLSISGSYTAPSFPGNTSNATLKIYAPNFNGDGINIGKNYSPYFEGWIQSGYGGSTYDHLSLQPLGGNVGIGTQNPTATLDVNGGAYVNGLVNINNVVKFKGFHSRNGVNGNNTNNIHNFYWTGSSLQAWVDGVFVGTVSFLSDRRLKDRIVPMKDNAVSRVMQLKPVSFHYKTLEGSIFKENPQIQEGFIADELQAVIPSAVIGEKDAVNAEGQIQPQTLNTTPNISLLTKAVQEQQQQIEMLLKRIEVLEQK